MGERRGQDFAWTCLWAKISNGVEISADDEAALLACARWRRKAGCATKWGGTKVTWKALTRGIRTGVPAALRGNVWYSCSCASSKKRSSQLSYAELLERG